MTESGDKITQSITKLYAHETCKSPIASCHFSDFRYHLVAWTLWLLRCFLGQRFNFLLQWFLRLRWTDLLQHGGDRRSDRSHVFGLAGLGNHHPAMVLLGQHLGLPCCPHCTCLEGTSSAAGCPSLHFARWKYGCNFSDLGIDTHSISNTRAVHGAQHSLYCGLSGTGLCHVVAWNNAISRDHGKLRWGQLGLCNCRAVASQRSCSAPRRQCQFFGLNGDFQSMGVPLNHPYFHRISMMNHPAIGYPHDLGNPHLSGIRVAKIVDHENPQASVLPT